jgi:hypothetical protein
MKAGVREVPIHSTLRPTIKRLVKAAAARPDDPYLIGGQRADKYNDRSVSVALQWKGYRTSLGGEATKSRYLLKANAVASSTPMVP